MDEHPDDAVDVIEEMSRNVKQDVFKGLRSTLRNVSQSSAAELLAEQQRLLFTPKDDSAQTTEMMGTVLPNLNEVAFYLEQAGVGLGREETQRVFLALKHLVESESLTHCRLWGKILGRESNYIIAEAETEYRDEEEELKQSAEEAPEEEKEAEAKEKFPVPRSTYKPPPLVPKEAIGTGANKYVYYVCSEPGLPWVKLPSVSPAQISAARQIKKFFTGRLNHQLLTYPPFPGNEANYLRAQIARISAGTQVSPHGFYQILEEEGDESDEPSQVSYEVNPEFEGTPVDEMAKSLSTWVHHVPHILRQGRCTWVNLAAKQQKDPNEDEEADEEDEEEHDEPEPEVGPPLLTPLSEDTGQKLFNIFRFQFCFELRLI
uniref:Radial spoke head component 4A n=1 Tax=Kryptolebias marmoratus TaxID=37003 RepID=A0A3Q3EPQ0_KRYMA